MDAKEEIRSRLSIEDVIGDYVELRRSGRNLKALSPFGNEKTPSFMVSPDKQIWHDFSSNKGGDMFSFIMEVEGVDFRGAMELLARKAGVDLSQYKNSHARDLHKKKERLYEVLELATKFYEFALSKHAGAQAYVFQKRKFTKQIVADFRLGYAPSEGASLVRFLTGRGFTSTEIKDAGLLAQRRNGPGDMFRGRIMVPLADAHGRIVGFTARILTDQKSAPKYINTPQTLLYDKSRHVYGLHLAKEAIRQNDWGVIVEGNLDVIASHQAGVKGVVATAGTALTHDHLKQLARMSLHIKLGFDRDKAGIAATERAIPIAQEIGVELSIVDLPEGVKDPDELVQKDVKAWQQVIDTSTYVVDWVIARYETLCDLTTAQGKRTFSSKAIDIVSTLKDAVEREHYLRVIAQKTGVSVQAAQQKMQAGVETAKKKAEVPKPLKPSKAKPARPDDFAYQDNFLALNAAYPEVRNSLAECSIIDVVGEHRRQFMDFLLQNPQVNLYSDEALTLQQDQTYGKILLLRAEERYGQWSNEDRYIEATALARRIKQETFIRKKQDLTTQITQAEQSNDEDRRRELLVAYQSLLQEEKRAKG